LHSLNCRIELVELGPLGYAIDRQALAEHIWDSYATVNLNPLPVGLAGWDSAIGEQHGTSYDPEKAKAELAALGWTDSDGDGVLDKDGESATFIFLTYSREQRPLRGAAHPND